jgi:hypothetical protein
LIFISNCSLPFNNSADYLFSSGVPNHCRYLSIFLSLVS